MGLSVSLSPETGQARTAWLNMRDKRAATPPWTTQGMPDDRIILPAVREREALSRALGGNSH